KTPWVANLQVKMFATYNLPLDFIVSATFLNVAGPNILANYTATNAQILPSLGRNLGACGTAAVCTGTATGIPLIAPATLYEDRRSQLDLRFSKLFKFAEARKIKVNVDVFNALNANTVLGINSAFGAAWRRPTSVLAGRTVEFGGQLSF